MCGGKEDQGLGGFSIEDAEGGYAIAFPKDSELTEELNNELKKMMENGEIDAIIKKWFDPESEEALKEEVKIDNAGKKVLKMATSADYAPFEFIDTEGTGDFVGLDIDIAKAITEKSWIWTRNSRYGFWRFDFCITKWTS